MKMNTTTRYVILVIVVLVRARPPSSFPRCLSPRAEAYTRQLGLHSILTFTHEGYGRATSISRLTGQLSWSSTSDDYLPGDEDYARLPPVLWNETRRANATLLMLARNTDVEGAVRSVRELEDRFNRRYGYPWTFLNEEPFSDEFKR